MSVIPTVAFDASKHVISGRETKEGRELFFTLASIVQAEQPLEQSIGATPEQLKELEARLLNVMSQTVPPPSMAAETAGVLSDLTKAIVSLKAENASLVSRVQRLEKTLVDIVNIGEGE